MSLKSALFRPRVITALALLPLLVLGTAGAAQASPSSNPTATNSPGSITQIPVSFVVHNVNRSKIACAVDGKTYTARGHITAQNRNLAHPETATLLLHGLSYGEFFGNFTAVPSYNFAINQAQAGRVTVTIDRLGYGKSDAPQGAGICFGSRADIAHQIVQQLKNGHYTAGQKPHSPVFTKVILAGHSVGAIIAQAEAYSFGDIDGLMVLSYSDTTVSPAAQAALATAITACKAGGERQHGTSGPTGYVYFGASTPQQFLAAHFYLPGADATVATITANMRNRDPCGDILSYKAAVAANLANVATITVPTLVVIGTKDAIYPIAAQQQAALLTGVKDLTAKNIANTGHALTLHRSKDQFSAVVNDWFYAHGYRGGHPQN